MNRTRRSHSSARLTAWRWLAVPVVLIASLGWAAGAQAQETGSLDVQMFRPNTHVHGAFTVDSARVLDHLDWNVGLFVNYGKNPLRRVRTDTGATVRRFVTDQVTGDLQFSMGLFGVFDLGVDLPFHMLMEGDGLTSDPDGLAESGMGDLRLIPKFQIVDIADIVYLGLAVDIQFPTGDDTDFMSWGDFRVTPRLNAEFDFKVVDILLNIGFRFQPERTIYNLTAGNEWYVSLGAVVPFEFNGGHKLDLIAESTLRAAIDEPFARGNETGLNIRGGLRYHTPVGLVISAGAGGGILPGYGEPDYRVFLGVHYKPPVAGESCECDPDPDCDHICSVCVRGMTDQTEGVPTNCGDQPRVCQEMFFKSWAPEQCLALCDKSERWDDCPNLPEDYDGFMDWDGCPDPDNDGDGICDPWVAANGMLDKYREICVASDDCPNLPEDFDGWHDEDGCPEPDNDCDRVGDPGLSPERFAAMLTSSEPWERCPNSEFPIVCEEMADDPAAICPEEPIVRMDDAGALLEDVCPLAPESYNHKADDDGCPDCVISFELPSGELFDHDRYELKPGAAKRLSEVARILKSKRWQDLSFIVEGHASDVYRGQAWARHDYNVKLSTIRAEVISAFLSGKKSVKVRRLTGKRRHPAVVTFSESLPADLVLDGDRLTSVGYGWERPKEPVPFGFEGRGNAGERVDEAARPEVAAWRDSCRRVEFRPIGRPAEGDGCEATKPSCIICK